MDITPYEYHSDKKKHGSYQYVPLSDIIDSFVLESLRENSTIKNEKRFTIIETAKACFREINMNLFKDVRAVQFTVPESPSFTLPDDFVDFVRVSVIEYNESQGGYYLKVLNKNTTISTAIGYLQNNKKELLFDSDGEILAVNHLNAYHKPYKKFDLVNGKKNNGDFRLDKRRGTILFSSDLSEKEIVLEFVSDGLKNSVIGERDIRVNKKAIEVLKAMIYFKLVEYRHNVPQNEKRRALLRLDTLKHEAKLDRLKLNIATIKRS